MALDVDKYIPVSKSDINLDKGIYSGNLGISDSHYILQPYADFVLVEYIDVEDDLLKTETGLYVSQSNRQLTWRRGKVVQCGPLVSHSKVGDLVVFPYDKGLPTNKVAYIDENKEIKVANNAIFISDSRLFARMGEL